jgi:pyridoxal phosphate enzyme (YggS family)
MLEDIGGISGIDERYRRINRRIEEACARGGRRREEVVLVGVSKTQPAEALAAAWHAGLRVFGENRVQEALAKSRELSSLADIEWHLIGPLQTNKVKAALDLFRTIHSVDRLRVAEALDQEAGRRGLTVSGFLEVNLGGEESKHGFAAEGRSPGSWRSLRSPTIPRTPVPGSAAFASCATSWPPGPSGPASPAGSRWA